MLKFSGLSSDNKLSAQLTNNTYINITIYTFIIIIILLCIAFCIKKCRNKSQKNKNNLEHVGTENSELISQSDHEENEEIELERPNSAYDMDKVKFFDIKECLNLKVQRSDGSMKEIRILSTAAISNLKDQIAKHLHIPVPKQEIYYNKKRCNSTCQISQYNIQSGDTIQVVELSDEQIRDQIKVTLKCNDNMEDKEVFCSNLITIRQFKKEVYAKIPVVPIYEQVLYFEDVELTDLDATLQEYGIHEDCMVVFEWKKIDITIQ